MGKISYCTATHQGDILLFLPEKNIALTPKFNYLCFVWDHVICFNHTYKAKVT